MQMGMKKRKSYFSLDCPFPFDGTFVLVDSGFSAALLPEVGVGRMSVGAPRGAHPVLCGHLTTLAPGEQDIAHQSLVVTHPCGLVRIPPSCCSWAVGLLSHLLLCLPHPNMESPMFAGSQGHQQKPPAAPHVTWGFAMQPGPSGSLFLSADASVNAGACLSTELPAFQLPPVTSALRSPTLLGIQLSPQLQGTGT